MSSGSQTLMAAQGRGSGEKILSGSVLSTEIFLSVLMRERTPLQATSVRVLLIMTGSEYTVERRNFEN